MKISNNGQMISHLFFPDDSLVFYQCSKTNPEDIEEIWGGIQPGDKTQKTSSMFFSKNIMKEVVKATLEALGNMQLAKKSKYVGLPTVI